MDFTPSHITLNARRLGIHSKDGLVFQNDSAPQSGVKCIARIIAKPRQVNLDVQVLSNRVSVESWKHVKEVK